MFLKRLEVAGFKSFAEQVNIEFVSGVTAVVGPNGSGKSNISDSIRWVLGEQSAKSLRGSKMEDIIFAGSDSRKPLNYAEVSLVLDNEDQHLAIDYSEVSVTRRVYRSGDSEYFINKQACRLKDIVDLFLDSGLGREAYSIIGQGKVEEILSSKPADRRVIFEEAAGVLKYKTRKEKAEKRLAETQENLWRVEDILHELEGQVEPLQIQASIAKDYLHKREELKEVEIALLVHEIHELHGQWEEEKDKLGRLRGSYEAHQQRLAALEEERLALREETEALNERYQSAQEELLVTSEELEKKEGMRQLLDERKKHASQNKRQLELASQEKEAQLKAVEANWRQEAEQLRQAAERVKELEQTVTGKEQLLAKFDATSEEEMEQYKADYIEVLNEQASIRNEKRYLEEQLRQQQVKQERLLQENEGLVAEREKLAEELAAATEQAAARTAALEQAGEAYRRKQREYETLKDRYHKQEAKLYEGYQMVQRLQSRADVLTEMEADFSGFFQGVKEVLKARGKLSGVVGAVAELIEVPKDYETAIEIALGGASQHIVTQSEADARKAIQFLKKNRSGRATFLPLPVIKPRHLPASALQQVEGHPAFIGVAASLVNYERTYEAVLSNLLGHVLIARDLPGANQLAALTGHRFRVVSLEGDVVNPGGSMTGGALKQKQSPLLGRKRELEELKQKLGKLTELTVQLEREVRQDKEAMKQLEQELEQLRQQGEEARYMLQEAKTAVQQLEKELERSHDQFSRFDREQATFTDEVERIKAKQLELDQRYETAVSEAEELERKVKELEELQVAERHSKETMQEELVADKIALATARERLAAVKEQEQRLKKEQAALDKEVSELKEHLQLLTGEMTDRSNGESGLAEQIDAYRRKKQELTEQIAAMKEKRASLDQAYVNLEAALKKQQDAHTLLADDCRKIEVKVNRMDVELDNRLEQLREEYELSFEAARANYQLTIDADEARTKVKLIKLALAELGTVNLGSIEEYERVRERFDFLSSQREDLMEAKQTLHDVIAEMDEEMTKRFYETYLQIRTHFQRVFKQLFGGGEADLVLTEPDHLLESGVDIVARPPGKKMQNLGLLSGGERALTAIGLLFAILYVRPVPFCVLDEVEAALDEANVSRFAHFLKSFSSETQFIVITHRKGTMEEADVLYGVTMQESGVSRIVSVKLEETKELIES
ncbi:chromosome segregation protein SMC [Alkalihalobacillus oceani]|uniref:chromosome segregation protein SMC n=1 Tax=Halalkalibacter oceani TaxID=1653776 RepID=UPI002040D016|nr:chromosome segregation protein SMC [Halalkalibacter oceani]MCM3759417.1 chromosome segregation protein SMC [Halalkalibacter oceani]